MYIRRSTSIITNRHDTLYGQAIHVRRWNSTEFAIFHEMHYRLMSACTYIYMYVCIRHSIGNELWIARDIANAHCRFSVEHYGAGMIKRTLS